MKWSKFTVGGPIDGRVRATIVEFDPDLPASPLRDAVRLIYDAVCEKREILPDGSEHVQPWLGKLLVTVRCALCQRRIAWVLAVVYTDEWLAAHSDQQNPRMLYWAEVRSSPPSRWLAKKARRVPAAVTLVRDLLDFASPPGTADHPPLRVGCGSHPSGELDRQSVVTAARRAEAAGEMRTIEFRPPSGAAC
jgi:hypothetical protein